MGGVDEVGKERRVQVSILSLRETLMEPWKVHGQVAGFHKIVGHLEIRTVNDAGHLVPMDQGRAAHAMAKSFIERSL